MIFIIITIVFYVPIDSLHSNSRNGVLHFFFFFFFEIPLLADDHLNEDLVTVKFEVLHFGLDRVRDLTAPGGRVLDVISESKGRRDCVRE